MVEGLWTVFNEQGIPVTECSTEEEAQYLVAMIGGYYC